MSLLGLAQAYAASRMIVLKANAPEIEELLREEAALRQALEVVHDVAARKAIEDALALVAGLVGGREASAAAVEAAIKQAYEAIYLPEARKLLSDAMPRFFNLGRLDILRRAGGPPPGGGGLGDLGGEEGPGIAPSFNLMDRRAVEALVRHQTFWIGEAYENGISQRVAAVSRQTILVDGLGGDEAGPVLRAALEEQFGLITGETEVPIPEGWRGSARQYHDMVASNAATVGRSFGAVRGLNEAGITRYIWNNPMDEATCVRCSTLDGKVFDVKDGQGLMDRILGAQRPEEVKEIHPWLSEERLLGHTSGPGHISAEDSRSLAAAGLNLPPIHGRCRCTIDIVLESEFHA